MPMKYVIWLLQFVNCVECVPLLPLRFSTLGPFTPHARASLGAIAAHFGARSGATALATTTAQKSFPASVKWTLAKRWRLHAE